MKLPRIIRLVFLLSFIPIFELVAQRTELNRISIRRFTDEDGLPQNSIKKITADAHGYIWMATEGGLVRFDGHHFQNFDKSNTAFRSNRIFDLKPDATGTDSAHLKNVRFYAMDETGRYIKVADGRTHGDTTYQSRPANYPSPEMNPQAKSIEAFGWPSYAAHFPYQTYIHRLRTGNQSFVCNKNQIAFYQKGKQLWRIAAPVTVLQNYFTHNNELYYRELNHFHFTKTDRNGKRTKLALTGDLLSDPVYCELPDKPTFFWNQISDQAYIYTHKKLYILEPSEDGMHSRLLLSGVNLAARYIQSLHYDGKAKMLFLGSSTQGLFVIKEKQFEPIVSGNGHKNDVFYAQTVARDGSIIAASGKRFYRDSVTGEGRAADLPAIKAVYQWDGRSMLTDRDGYIWMKHDARLFRFDKKAGKLLDQVNMNKEDEIKTISQDPSGLIWLGMHSGSVFSLDPRKKQAKAVPFISKGLKDITYMIPAGKTALWIGTRNGLYLLNTQTRVCKLMTQTAGMYITSIQSDSSGDLWLTIVDQGLAVLHLGQLIIFPADRYAYLRSAHCIVPDLRGFLWIPTNKGLFQVRKADLLAYADLRLDKRPHIDPKLFYQYYDKSDGFLINEFNGSCQPCAVRLPDGTVSLPSLRGVVWFNPDSLKLSQQTKLINIDRVGFNGESRQLETNTVYLPKNPKQVKFFLSTPYYGHLNNVQMSYSFQKRNVLPQDNDWEPIQSENQVIAFSTLSAGDYDLTIRKWAGFGKETYFTRKIFVVVPPIWYATWHAWVLYILLGCSLIYFFIRWRVRRVKRENALLEERISSRTNDLNEAVTELEASKNEVSRQLHLMSLLLTSMTHDIQSPLRFMAHMTRRVPEMMEQNALNDVSDTIRIVGDSAQEMNTLLGDLLDYLKTNLHGNALHPDAVNLRMLVNGKYQIFKNVIESRNNRFSIDIPEDLTITTDYQMLSIVIHNMIDNAVKHTRDGEIRVYSSETEEDVELTIANNGAPLPPDLINWFNRSWDDTPPTRSTPGLGLVIMREVAALTGFRLTVSQSDLVRFTMLFEKKMEEVVEDSAV